MVFNSIIVLFSNGCISQKNNAGNEQKDLFTVFMYLISFLESVKNRTLECWKLEKASKCESIPLMESSNGPRVMIIGGLLKFMYKWMEPSGFNSIKPTKACLKTKYLQNLMLKGQFLTELNVQILFFRNVSKY